MQLRCYGVFRNHVITNFPQNMSVKNFENRSIFGEDIGQKFATYFFGSRGIRTYIHLI